MRFTLSEVCKEAQKVQAELLEKGEKPYVSTSALVIAVVEYCFEVEQEKWKELIEEGVTSDEQRNKVLLLA
jgi:lipocalin